jgi:hypothetical protein
VNTTSKQRITRSSSDRLLLWLAFLVCVTRLHSYFETEKKCLFIWSSNEAFRFFSPSIHHSTLFALKLSLSLSLSLSLFFLNNRRPYLADRLRFLPPTSVSCIHCTLVRCAEESNHEEKTTCTNSRIPNSRRMYGLNTRSAWSAKRKVTIYGIIKETSTIVSIMSKWAVALEVTLDLKEGERKVFDDLKMISHRILYRKNPLSATSRNYKWNHCKSRWTWPCLPGQFRWAKYVYQGENILKIDHSVSRSLQHFCSFVVTDRRDWQSAYCNNEVVIWGWTWHLKIK